MRFRRRLWPPSTTGTSLATDRSGERALAGAGTQRLGASRLSLCARARFPHTYAGEYSYVERPSWVIREIDDLSQASATSGVSASSIQCGAPTTRHVPVTSLRPRQSEPNRLRHHGLSRLAPRDTTSARRAPASADHGSISGLWVPSTASLRPVLRRSYEQTQNPSPRARSIPAAMATPRLSRSSAQPVK